MTDHTARPSGAALLQELSAIPPLQLPGVVVYLISRRNAQNVATQLHELLDSDEKARSTRLSTWEQRSRFVTGRVALRCALTILEGGIVAEPDWRFGASENGKPNIRAPKSSIRSFNLSYARDLIAIGISREVDVGVDIEIRHEIPQHDFPWHLFSAEEQRILRAATDAERLPVFLRLWTLKEAIAKRTGQGFATEFSEIDTTVLTVCDGLELVGGWSKADYLLFHTDLQVQGTTVYLSVSTAPIRQENVPA